MKNQFEKNKSNNIIIDCNNISNSILGENEFKQYKDFFHFLNAFPNKYVDNLILLVNNQK